MNNYVEYRDKIAFHPGYYIKEIMEEERLNLAELARRLDASKETVNALIRGDQSISVDIAEKLSCMLGTSAEFWLNLQKAYNADLVKIKTDKEQQGKQI